MAAESRRRNEERIAAEQLAHEKELTSEKEFKETLRSWSRDVGLLTYYTLN